MKWILKKLIIVLIEALVVAGLVDVPVIAVPTSVGYGVGEGGRVALDSMLQSCAPGIAVVNIDNGLYVTSTSIDWLSPNCCTVAF